MQRVHFKTFHYGFLEMCRFFKESLEYFERYIEGNNFLNNYRFKPTFTISYIFLHIHMDKVKNQTNKMLERVIIRPSNTHFSSPVRIVPKN